MTAPAFPSLDAQDLELAAMCETAAVQALGDGDVKLASFLWNASEWHMSQIEARRSARIWGTLAAMAAARRTAA